MQPARHPTDLLLYRLRMGFSKKYVASLLGHKNTSLISKLEQGLALPTLPTALKLAAIYRVPVDFLYSEIYDGTRGEIRGLESRLPKPVRQPALF